MATTWTARQSASSGNRRTLIISVVFGLLAAFLVFKMVSDSGSKGGSSTGVPVVVAKQDIPAKVVITDAMLTIKNVPTSAKVANVYTDAKVPVGKFTKQAIAANEQVVSTRVADSPKELGFAGVVPEGYRAVSIGVNEVSTGGGLIQPGDHVDVIGLFLLNDRGERGSFVAKADADSQGRVVAATILQDVQLLAIAQEATDVSGGKTGTKLTSGKGSPDARSVTLAVTPEDAEKLTLADAMGTLRLSLHRFNDHDLSPIPQVDNSAPSILGNSTASAQAVDAPQPTATPKR